MRLVLATLSACLVAQAQIPAQDVRNTYVPNTDTHLTVKTCKTLDEWHARRDVLRKQILSASGLLPLLPKNDLRAQVFGRIENRDCSIEKVLLETLPGYYLGGNLYRPLKPAPAGGFPGWARARSATASRIRSAAIARPSVSETRSSTRNSSPPNR